MKKHMGTAVIVYVFLLMGNLAFSAEEMYIITTRDGSSIVVRDYRFTDEYIEYTTDSGLPGYIRREEFVKIANMVGVPPGETERFREQVSRDERSRKIGLLAGAVLVVSLAVLLVYLSGKKRRSGRAQADIYYGRQE
ncbi:MAG TPA: hypothetical protein ENO11_06065, partial [Desulfobacteraceae bacterium]|nr:hypothetical protein [Desulfobacteraceae bacterium]